MSHVVPLRPHGLPGGCVLVAGPTLRLADPEAALAFLRRCGSDRPALADLRCQLACDGADVARLSDDEVLRAVARHLASGRWSVAAGPPADRRFAPGLRNPRPELQKVEPVRRPTVPDEETYVLVAEVRTIGGTLLRNHPVRILDPDTGVVVVDEIETDGKGVVRTRVPRDKTYRIEILDETWEPPAHPFVSDDACAMLACRFVDDHGVPVADTLVEARHGDDQHFDLHTDADGRLESPAAAGLYELRVRGLVFHAHTVLPEDLALGDDGEASGDAAEGDDGARELPYEFVLPAAAADHEPAPEGEGDHRLVRETLWFDADDGWHRLEGVA